MSSLTPLEQELVAAVDADALVRDLADLVATAPVDGTPGEEAVQAWCADRLAASGLAVDTWRTPMSRLEPADGFPGAEVERSALTGCVGVLGGPADPGLASPALALCGHTDVVPAAAHEAWQGRSPFELTVTEGIARARGACDMLGGVAASLAAVSALEQLRAGGMTLRRPAAIHCVSAEEDGGAGAFDLLRRGHRADGVVIAEPTDGAVIPANAGSLTFRLEVPGIATHGSSRLEGVSAVSAFEHVHTALRELEAERNDAAPDLFGHLPLPFALAVGIVRAGDWASTVPDLLVAEGRYGVRVGETAAAAREVFERTVALSCAEHPFLVDRPATVTWPGGCFEPGAIPADHPLVEATVTAAEDLTGVRPERYGAPYGSDLRHYVAHGVPALQYGAGEVRQAHAAGEHVAVDDLVAAARTYALMLARTCGDDPDRTRAPDRTRVPAAPATP